jgi:hypothetical protein
MGPNLNDSMSNAIENAAAIFVFMTAKYKESANCRKECTFPVCCLNIESGTNDGIQANTPMVSKCG